MVVKTYQCGLVKLWNSLARIRTSGKSGELISLNDILVRVEKKPGSSFCSSAPHINALRMLIASINETGGLHSFGRFYINTLFTELLLNRVQLNDLWKIYPEILNERVEKPIIILGLPRSGTSFLFNLLAQDPNHRFLRNWETTVAQVPPPGSYSFSRDPRRRKGRYLMWFQDYLAPQLKDIHEFHLDGPEECTPLLMQGFATQALAGMFDVPAYSRWLDSVSGKTTYHHHKRILQTLQWKYPGLRWVLKSPDHLAAIDAIVTTYPDACLVHIHRDPLQTVASWASLNAAFRGITTKSLEPDRLGQQVLDRLATDMDRYLEQRQHHTPDRFLDVRYDDLINDPIKVVERIYRHFDLDFSSATQGTLRLFLDRDRAKTRHHRYSAQDYGLSAEIVDARFRNYIDTFSVPLAR